MPDGFYKDLVKELLRIGFVYERPAKGSHEQWGKANSKDSVTVPRNLYSRHTANGILKKAGSKKNSDCMNCLCRNTMIVTALLKAFDYAWLNLTTVSAKELYLNNFAAKRLISKRWKKHPLCQTPLTATFESCYAQILEQELVTPDSIFNDPKLELIFSNYRPFP